MVIEVKGGASVPVTALRALKGVLDYDTALLAGLITMHPIKDTQARNFNHFMAEAGTLEILGIEYPRMQMLSVRRDTRGGSGFKRPRYPGGICGRLGSRGYPPRGDKPLTTYSVKLSRVPGSGVRRGGGLE